MPGDAVPEFMRRVQQIREAWDALPAQDTEALVFDRAAPRGLPGRDMTAPQRTLLRQLVDVYVGRLEDALAAVERAAFDDAAIDALHFAWAGPDAPGEGHYYRLQGERFLIEYDNTQDDANHVHAVWRDPSRDFGIDSLRAHVAADH
jgi:hypothetical protein